MTVLSVTDATFEAEVMSAELPVLIDLYADWCQPCKAIAPLVAELAGTYAGKLKVVKIDVEANPMIAQAFQVQSIPMLVLMQNGQVAGHHLGALDREALRKLVAPIVGAAAGASVRELSTKELSELIKGGAALPVDLREPAAYGRYRIPTALNIPAEEIDTRLAELRPGDGRIRVLYSRSAEPASAVAEKLGSAGLEIGFLAGGFLHWEADGYEVERG